MVVQRTPRSEAVRPTRRAISPRLAMRTEVMGVELEGVVERWRGWDTRRALAMARDRVAGIIVTWSSKCRDGSLNARGVKEVVEG